LEKIVDLTLQKAEALGYDENPYDALLDEFEPGMKTAQVAALFEEMRAGLVPLVEAISDRVAAVDGSLFDQGFDRDKQWEFGIEVLTALGFDFDRGRQDIAAHPFTTSFSTNDVRLTTRVYPHQFKTAIFGSIHESGHGMYNQGFDPTLNRTLLSSGASLGVHESQSRLWENIVGRSRGFWIHWLPRLKHYFPIQLDGISVEHFYRAINRVHPSFIRVEADEVTYNLHIFLRFEIENLMIQGQVKIADLPELWNDRMEEYLGIRPADAAQGVLQDVHWSHGLIGYFPTYALGNLLSVQLYNLAVADRPEIPASIKAGEYSPLLDWMRDHIHVHGRKYTPVELIERETGGPIRTGPFLEYIQTKYSEIYDL
jgi:carboxypeptidase Taq